MKEDIIGDGLWMGVALDMAKQAAKKGEVPVGAVIIRNGKIIAKAHNMREKKQNALAHAEVLAIARACRRLRSWRLGDCAMYVTLQPCPMCAGAILNARIPRLVIGTLSDDGEDQLGIYTKNNLNHSTRVEVLGSAECGEVLKKFFGEKRRSQ